MSITNASDTNYALGHSKEELERLQRQAAFFYKSTRDLLFSAGIATGMRVVDFGTGAGDVAMLLSELVGKTGEVIAVDRAPAALERAKHRMAARGLKNVTTFLGDEKALAEAFQTNKVDAIVGRLVLEHQKAPNAVFCKLVESVRPGGIVAFQDIDVAHDPWAKPALPLMSKVWDQFMQAVMLLDVSRNIGIDISKSFDQAGIQARQIVLEGVIESGPDALGYAMYMELIRAAVPLLQKNNIAMIPEIIELETLADHLRDEAVACQAVFVPFYLVSAYGRTPA